MHSYIPHVLYKCIVYNYKCIVYDYDTDCGYFRGPVILSVRVWLRLVRDAVQRAQQQVRSLHLLGVPLFPLLAQLPRLESVRLFPREFVRTEA